MVAYRSLKTQLLGLVTSPKFLALLDLLYPEDLVQMSGNLGKGILFQNVWIQFGFLHSPANAECLL